MNAMQGNKYLTTKEVARFLNINEKMVYTLVNDKGLPATKMTGKWLVSQTSRRGVAGDECPQLSKTGIERFFG